MTPGFDRGGSQNVMHHVGPKDCHPTSHQGSCYAHAFWKYLSLKVFFRRRLATQPCVTRCRELIFWKLGDEHYMVMKFHDVVMRNGDVIQLFRISKWPAYEKFLRHLSNALILIRWWGEKTINDGSTIKAIMKVKKEGHCQKK